MSRLVEFQTPEQVAIQYELAGIGSRAVAAAVDAALQLLAIGLLCAVPVVLVQMQVLPGWSAWSNALLYSLGTLLIFLILWGYYLYFETLWNGETPGKRLLGLRVIKDGGYPVDFRAVVIRTLVRAADLLPGVPVLPLYGFGIVSALLHPRYQRLGDMAAGTLVIRHGAGERARRDALGAAQVFRLLDPTALTLLARLTREEFQTVQRFLERRGDLPFHLQGLFAQRLAQQLIARMGYQEPELGMDYLRWLEELDLAYRQRALAVSTAAAPPAPAPVAAPIAPAPETAEEAGEVGERRW